jgi:hypothetical protein
MLTIGNFLGANGLTKVGDVTGDGIKRNLGIISIIHAFVIHARFVPTLRGKWIFNLMSMFALLYIIYVWC